MRSPRARVLAAITAVAAFAVPAADALAAENARPVKVMTRNLYLGGDIGKPATAALTAPAGTALVAFGNANAALAATVEYTNFPERAKLLAAEIADHEPDLIGLQEVAVWRSSAITELPVSETDLGNFAIPNATDVDYDFLAILLDELEALGEDYTVVTDTLEADVEGPAFTGAPVAGGGFTPLGDHRLTMHDVILARDDVTVRDRGTGNYAANFAVTLGGREFRFTRGYGWADVRVNKRSFRFVNTHLESQFSIYALLQAQQLMATVAAPQDQPVVLVCDCNSDPLNGSGKPPTDPTPHWAPYRFITGPGGFTDEWLKAEPSDPGFTSGLSETVDDPDLSDIDHRIDMVFGRREDGKKIPASRGWVTGDEAQTEDGLWASDHMGVVVALKP